jgi:hypothetical protein
MESLDYWRLCDEFSVINAALLIVGEDPSNSIEYIQGWKAHICPDGYFAAKTALINAIYGKRLNATLRYPARVLLDGEYEKIGEKILEQGNEFEIAIKDVPDWGQTTIKVEDLRSWLISRGFKTGFFFADHVDAPDYLDKSHSCYAPKLAAAVDAWQAIASDEALLDGKTPKQAIEKWLRENASRFGLSDDDGNPNKDGIEQISKVANWRLEGGAAKTRVNPPTPRKPSKDHDF